MYGGSSGAIVFGNNISTFEEEEDTIGVGEKGLDLIKGYSIYCHLTEDMIPRIRRFSKEKGTPIIAMPENSGVFFGRRRCESGGI